MRTKKYVDFASNTWSSNVVSEGAAIKPAPYHPASVRAPTAEGKEKVVTSARPQRRIRKAPRFLGNSSDEYFTSEAEEDDEEAPA
jgi:hypothetical protein